MVDWSKAGSIGITGVLTVFVVLILLAIMVYVIGLILRRRSGPAEKNT